MKKICLCLVVAGCAAIASAAGMELEDPVLLPSYGGLDAYRPAVGYGKEVYLVVWQAGRVGKGDLVFCRVGADGKVLDAKPLVLCAAVDDQERPKAAFGGGVYLVVWQDIRNGKDYDVYAARVTAEGRVLDKDGFLVAGGKHNQSRPRVCFDGKNFFVAWEDLRNGKHYAVYGARITTDGKVLDKGGILLNASERFNRYMPAVASLGDGEILVVWCGTKYWVGAGKRAGYLFVRSGRVQGESVILEGIKDANGSIGGGGRGGTPVSACAGKEGYLVLWRNHRPAGRAGGGWRSNCALFIDRKKGWKKGETLNLTGKPHVTMDPEAAWDGKGFICAWTEQRWAKRNYWLYECVVVARVDARGRPLGGGVTVAGRKGAPANRVGIASDGKGKALVVYEQHPAAADTPIKVGCRVVVVR